MAIQKPLSVITDDTTGLEYVPANRIDLFQSYQFCEEGGCLMLFAYERQVISWHKAWLWQKYSEVDVCNVSKCRVENIDPFYFLRYVLAQFHLKKPDVPQDRFRVEVRRLVDNGLIFLDDEILRLYLRTTQETVLSLFRWFNYNHDDWTRKHLDRFSLSCFKYLHNQILDQLSRDASTTSASLPTWALQSSHSPPLPIWSTIPIKQEFWSVLHVLVKKNPNLWNDVSNVLMEVNSTGKLSIDFVRRLDLSMKDAANRIGIEFADAQQNDQAATESKRTVSDETESADGESVEVKSSEPNTAVAAESETPFKSDVAEVENAPELPSPIHNDNPHKARENDDEGAEPEQPGEEELSGSGGKFCVEKWSDLAIGIHEDGSYYAFPELPELGSMISLKDAKKLNLPGKQWKLLLSLFASSANGKEAMKKEILHVFGYYGTPSEEELSEPFENLGGLKKATSQLATAIGNLNRRLRLQVEAKNDKLRKGPPMSADHDKEVRASFTTRCLLRDKDQDLRFGCRK